MSEASAPTVDVAVIGGGAAGLSAASALGHRDIVLLERGHRLGGRLHSLERGQDWINLGAHLLTGGPSNIKALTEECRLPVRAVPGIKTALWFDGRLHKSPRVETYPFRLPLTVRQRLDLVRTGAKVRLLAARWARVKRRRTSEDDDGYNNRMRGYRAGRTFDALLEGVAPKVAEIFRTAARRSAGEAHQITVGGAAALFGALWVSEGSSSVVNVDGGSGRIGRALEERLGDRAVLGAEVTDVAELSDAVEVTYRVEGVEHRVRARRAIVATPAPETVRLVRSLPAHVAAELASIEYGAFVCLGVLTSELPDLSWDDVYAIVAPGAAFDMLFNHSNPFRSRGDSPTRRSLMCYVGGRRAQEMLEMSDAEVEQTLLSDLVKVMPEVAGAIEQTAVARWRMGNSLPTPSARLDRTQAWNRRCNGRLYLAGDYFAPLGGTVEGATVSGIRSAEMVESAARLDSTATAEPRTSLARTD